MSGAITSRVDLSWLNAAKARRRMIEREPANKLSLLRRLRRQYEMCCIPKSLKETNVEQSFAEQIFAKVLGYRTLFSHDKLPFHLLPKNYFAGARQYDDFSIGLFSQSENIVVASVELKGPGAELDKKQTGNYGGVTPVEQAITAASSNSNCKWVIVSNYKELRLYDLAMPTNFLATVDLHEVKNSIDLAFLCAHFDARALLGEGTQKGDLIMPADGKHPSLPISSQLNNCRIVLRFTPQKEKDVPLFLLEDKLADACAYITSLPSIGAIPSVQALVGAPVTLQDGWMAIESDQRDGIAVRISLSTLGQLQVSFRKEIVTSRGSKEDLNIDVLFTFLSVFAHLVDQIYSQLDEYSDGGLVSSELREIDGVKLVVPAEKQLAGRVSYGLPVAKEFIGTDIRHAPQLDSSQALILDLLSDLAVYFRETKGGVRFDRSKYARD